MSFRPHHRGYHHGNLRDALVDAALALIAERGLGGITFAEVARAVGVSAAAPYRHFRDLGELVAEVTRRGFARLADELEAAWAGGRPDAFTAIENCGHAYIRFARREPATYATLFNPSAATAQKGVPGDPSGRVFDILRRAAQAACDTVPGPRRPPATMVALHVWALSHGTAALFVGHGGAANLKLPMPPEDLLEAGLLLYLQSLGNTAPPA